MKRKRMGTLPGAACPNILFVTAVAAAMAAAAVVAAGMLPTMIMMAAAGSGIINQISTEESIYHVICFASYTAHDDNAGLIQCHPGTTADAATDQ